MGTGRFAVSFGGTSNALKTRLHSQPGTTSGNEALSNSLLVSGVAHQEFGARLWMFSEQDTPSGHDSSICKYGLPK